MSIDILATVREMLTKNPVIPTSSTEWNTNIFISTANSSLSPTVQGNMHGMAEPLASLVIRLLLTTTIFLCTVVGNALTIYVIKQNRALRSIKNYYYGYYLMNLSISDLFVGVMCIPFTVVYHQTEKWPFGSLFCKLMPTMQVMSVSASISTLTYITFERYQAIVYPLKPRSSFLRLKITLAVIWMWSLVVGIPSFASYQHNSQLPKFQCQEVWSKPLYRRIYTVVLFCVNYAIPLIFIFMAYARILYELKGRRVENVIDSTNSRVLHRRFVKLMLILVTSFALCYLPNNVMFFLLDFTVIQDKYLFGIILNYTLVLVWLSSCLNPFIYGTLDSYFKKGYKKAIGMSINSDTKIEVTMVGEDYGNYTGRPHLTFDNNSSWPSRNDSPNDQTDFDSIFKDYKSCNSSMQKDTRYLSPAVTELDSKNVEYYDHPSKVEPSSSLPAITNRENVPFLSPEYSDAIDISQRKATNDDSKEIFISLDTLGFSPFLNSVQDSTPRESLFQDHTTFQKSENCNEILHKVESPNYMQKNAKYSGKNSNLNPTPKQKRSIYDNNWQSNKNYNYSNNNCISLLPKDKEHDYSTPVQCNQENEIINRNIEKELTLLTEKDCIWYKNLLTENELGKIIEELTETTL